jgi:hypothetical protein
MLPDEVMRIRLRERQAAAVREFGYVVAGQFDRDDVQRWFQEQAIFSVPWHTAAGEPLDVLLRFQFKGGQPRAVIQRVLLALDKRSNSWSTALWFTSNNGWLPRQARPVDLLESSPDSVVEAAARDAQGSAA